MIPLSRATSTFPSVSIPSESGGLAVEVWLIAQMGPGAGNHLFASVAARQQQHEAFINELNEPSAKLGGTDFPKGDATSLYSFSVGPQGHPFHRHAGHRVFTAISGSGGAQLRFSTAPDALVKANPLNFVSALRFINIPPDCLFSVRFGGETWHQFASPTPNSVHPVFFALSCHTNELGGHLDPALQAQVLNNQATIASLTEVLPPHVEALLQSPTFQANSVPTTDLSLDAPPGTLQRTVCNTLRSKAGRARGLWARLTQTPGTLSYADNDSSVQELPAPPANSLLLKQLANQRIHHEDTFQLSVTKAHLDNLSASLILSAVLDGFLKNPATGISQLMAVRNLLVRPLGLRTSRLGCPVSSLLSPDKGNLFANRHPVLDQATNSQDTQAQVILGANDKHLLFRSCVGVVVESHHIHITLGTRVHCTNLFGRFYMAAINFLHRRYITPTMLRFAVEYAVAQRQHNLQNNTQLNPVGL